MIKVYGASDDLLEIEGYGEIDCYGKAVRVCFDDGTVIWCSYGKPDLAVWQKDRWTMRSGWIFPSCCGGCARPCCC